MMYPPVQLLEQMKSTGHPANTKLNWLQAEQYRVMVLQTPGKINGRLYHDNDPLCLWMLQTPGKWQSVLRERPTLSVDVTNSWEMAVRITRTTHSVCGCYKLLGNGSQYYDNDPLCLWMLQTPGKWQSVLRERPTLSVDVTNSWEMAVNITRTTHSVCGCYKLLGNGSQYYENDPLCLWMLQTPGKWQSILRERPTLSADVTNSWEMAVSITRTTHSVCGCYKLLGNGSQYYENDPLCLRMLQTPGKW